MYFVHDRISINILITYIFILLAGLHGIFIINKYVFNYFVGY